MERGEARVPQSSNCARLWPQVGLEWLAACEAEEGSK